MCFVTAVVDHGFVCHEGTFSLLGVSLEVRYTMHMMYYYAVV